MQVDKEILVYGDGLLSPEERRAAARQGQGAAAALQTMEGSLAGRLEKVLGSQG